MYRVFNASISTCSSLGWIAFFWALNGLFQGGGWVRSDSMSADLCSRLILFLGTMCEAPCVMVSEECMSSPRYLLIVGLNIFHSDKRNMVGHGGNKPELWGRSLCCSLLIFCSRVEYPLSSSPV